MSKIITVKGIANVSVAPDLVVINIRLETKNKDYEAMMARATEATAELENATVKVGFLKNDLKTTDFSIGTYDETYRDKDNNYMSRFGGFVCYQSFKLEFDLNYDTLHEVLETLSAVLVEPKINIDFTVKDKNAVSEALLEKASANARMTAEILAKASGVKLGDLLSIDYNWEEIHLTSSTVYATARKADMLQSAAAPTMVADDIDASDTVTFSWEII